MTVKQLINKLSKYEDSTNVIAILGEDTENSRILKIDSITEEIGFDIYKKDVLLFVKEIN